MKIVLPKRIRQGIKKKVNTTYNMSKLIKDIKGGNIYEKDIINDNDVS